MDKNIETILTALSHDCRKKLRYYPLRRYSFSKVIVFGKRENYELFKEHFDKITRKRYSERVEYDQIQPKGRKDLYIINLDSLL